MIKVGLTGGIGCGKSYVADLLRRRHIPVYDTDKEAKRLMMESATIRRGLVDWVGERAYMPDGTLNRERIASYLFASPLHAERINRLVHPVVQDDFLQWVDKQDGPLVVMECAILYESETRRGFRSSGESAYGGPDVGRRALQTGALYYK